MLIPVAGILDVLDNYAFVRTSGYLLGSNDIYVSLAQVRKYGLRRGDAITGSVRQPRDGERREKFNALVRLETVNGTEPDTAKTRPDFNKLTPLYPQDRLRLETEPQLLQILAPNEAVVSIGLEVRVGENTGLMNIGMPSIIIKMLRNKFDQQWSMRRAQSSEDDQVRMLRLLQQCKVEVDTRLQGPTLSFEGLMALEPGKILTFDFPVGRELDMVINGRTKYKARVVSQGHKRAARLGQVFVGRDYQPLRE